MQQTKECNNCGHINKADAVRCMECGHRFSGVIVSPPPKTVAPLPIQQPDDNRPIQRSNSWQKISGVVLLIILVGGGLLFILRSNLHRPLLTMMPTSTPSILPPLPNDLGVVKAPNGENVGVNDGKYEPFDIGPQRKNSQLKMDAVQALKDNDIQRAKSQWNESLSGPDTNDAEVKIYLENQNASAFPHITLIVGLDFIQPFPDTISQSVLQGAYMAQQKFNDQHTKLKMRLLLANTGGEPNYIPPVIRQLAQIIKKDSTIVGILGWETSSRTANVLADLQQYQVNIPILSESAMDDHDHLKGASPHFFRIAPPNIEQAPVLSKLADMLPATQATVFKDITNAYTQNIAQDFEKQFKQVHSSSDALIEASFKAGQTNTAQFSTLLHQALKNVHDTNHVVIFFSGAFLPDENNFQEALKGYPNLPVISGSTGYNVTNKSVYGRWYFTASAFHDEWKILAGKDNPFFMAYSNEFDMGPSRPSDYGYRLPTDIAIASYDGASVLAYGIDMAISYSKRANTITPQDLENTLSQITGTQAFQGVSGLIDFQPDHDPNNKAFVVLKIDKTGHLQLLCVQGHFTNGPENPQKKCDAVLPS